ncbi:hypothetical protein GO755_38415 [Spirosoma sp. HMF4905]|uniref:SD-repeat containing protein B domain-containing protein n=1 Tax=Spirosoma arboris TaxID=2682092 RepID=A0A7K1SQ86_9BACT|nr:SdrD B-like domain-containing protein [Spirosoma arboris]MVM35951.1 hypothetical protein [Spirosoma arboris]
MKKKLYTKKDKLVNCSTWGEVPQVYQIIYTLFFFITSCLTAHAQISGTVYRDFNEDGIRSFTAATPLDGEIGVGGVTVNIYNATGLVGSTVTSSATAIAGSYTATVSGTGPYRVEFVGLPTGYYDGFRGAQSGTSVQFIDSSPATDVNLGINYPYDYCQPIPNFLVPCYVNGDPLGGGTSGLQNVFVTLPYNSTSSQMTTIIGGNTDSETAISINNELGTVYGVAYQRATKYTYTAAFIKRHAGLGVGGAGGIYITKSSGGTYTSSLFTTLPTAATAIISTGVSGTVATLSSSTVGSNTDRGLPATLTDRNRDPSAFDLVGKAGLGDLEVSEDGTQLYVVNLGDRRLYQIPIVDPTSANPTAGTPTSYEIPSPSQKPGSVFRPFGLKYYRGRVYVGGVTTNEGVEGTVNFGVGGDINGPPSSNSLITQDTTSMKAVVYEYNPIDNSFTDVLSFPLTYQKGAPNNDKVGADRAEHWLPWISAQPTRFARNDLPNCSYPQPMLTGIEFDVDGSMIISIRDRFGDQYGNNNLGPDANSTPDPTQTYRAIAPGDILRAGKCIDGVNKWTLEYNASVCNGIATAGANTTQGPGNGEYYYGDAVGFGLSSGPFHLEVSEGALALLPGSGEVASIALNPTFNVNSGGIRRFRNADGSGSASTSVQIYRSDDPGTYGKANGLGDLELDCDLPPIQIGNRVWRDINNNGLQEPGEPGLAGVQVVLQGPGSTTIATVTTNANGEYYFSNAVGTNVLGSVYNLTLTTGGSYTLSFPTSVSAFTISTPPGSTPATDAIDSNPDATGSIAFTLGQAGQNNFTYDAGYVCAPLALSLTSVTVCAGQPISLTATDGFSSYTFSTGLTQIGITNVASATAAGTYSVTALNSAGCSGTATGSSTIEALPVITLTSQTICAGQIASLTATAGYASYIFSTGLAQLGTSNVAIGTTDGTYSVTAISTAGCAGTATGSITVNPLPIVTLSSASVCAGQTAVLMATAGFDTYLFSAGLSQVGNSNVATATVDGIYSVTAINSQGCSGTATGSITINPLPVVTLSSVTICAGQSATLTATAGYASYQFPLGLTPVIGQPNVATGTVGGTYSVTVTSVDGCVSEGSGTITVNPLPVVALTSATMCAGQTVSLTATAGYASYVFSAGLTQLNASNVAVGATDGTYSVTAINTAGCSATATGSITINANPVVTLSSATVCAGQTAILSATPGYTTYLFSSGLAQVGSSNVATGTADGIYSVTAISDVGCSGTATGSITVNPLPVVDLISATICVGQSATLVATAGYASYTFSAGLTPISGQPNMAIGTVDGTYSVTATSVDGCVGTGAGSITVSPLPVVTLSSTTICAGQSATLVATSGYDSYSFSAGLTPVAGTPNAAIGDTGGLYSVTATTLAGCSATATSSITVNPLPVVSLTSATICIGQTASLSATAGYASYLFSTGLTPVPGTPNVATGTADGIYSVTAISTDGCSATTTGSITVSPAVVVTLSSATICAGQVGVLTATAGYDTYIFSAGLTQDGVTNIASGTVDGMYSVTAISAAGCIGTATGSITVNPSAVVALSSATICAGQSATLTATPGFANYVFSVGLTPVIGQPNVAIGTIDGTYSVTATSSASCSGSATGTITITPLPIAVIAVSSATLCEGQSATLTASGGDLYAWSTGEQSASIVVTTSNVYSVTVSTITGCSDVASTTITVNPLPVLTVNSATVCSGQSATLTITGCEGGTILWSTTESTATILVSPVLTAAYSATCTFATGCSSTTSTTVTVNDVPWYTAVPQATTATCTGAVANNDARIDFATLQNTERADIVAGSTYGSGPAYGAPTNVTVTAGTVSFTNLLNPATSQPYTIRLYSPGGTCYTDVTVILEPAFCNCPDPKCVPLIIQKTRTGRTAIR